MTDKQPEALRLAELLDDRLVTRWVHATGDTPRAAGYAVDIECAQAAAELRRLHEVNAELVEALKKISMGGDPRWADDAIAKATGEQQ